MTAITISPGPIKIRATVGSTTALPLHSQLKGGIKVVRFRASFPSLSGGIKVAYQFPCEAGIESFSISPPTDPIAASIGQGSLIIKWRAPECQVWYYNVYGAVSLDGEYGLVSGRIRGVSSIISNLPVGVGLYLRVTAVHHTGLESDYVQVKAGRISKPLVLMSVRMIMGSIITNEAVFGALDPNTRSVSTFSAVGDIQV